MVSHRHRRTILTVLGLYIFAALFIGYFGMHAFSGDRGLRAQQDLEQQLTAMKGELAASKLNGRIGSAQVSLLRADRIDPDMLDERARAADRAISTRAIWSCWCGHTSCRFRSKTLSTVRLEIFGQFAPSFAQFRAAASRFRRQAI